ncbi:MAG: DegV family protein [Gammaproteobacteria bacterium]
MPTKIGIVIDPTCDLPRSFIDQNGLEILPVLMRFGHMSFRDLRDPEQTMDLYRRFVGAKKLEITTEPLSTKAIRDLFLEQWVLKYDRVMLLTVARSRSTTYENATQASFMVLSAYKERRRAAGLDEQFNLRVVDSQSIFAGQAVTVCEALRAMHAPEGILFDQLRQQVENFCRQVRAFVVPQDLYYLRNRGAQKGDKSVGLLGYQMGSMFDIKPILQCQRGETQVIANVRGYEPAVHKLFDMAIAAIEHGLASKVVCMSYAGDPDSVKSMPGYDAFIRCAAHHKVDTLLSVMSTTEGIHVGPGAFSLAYAER